jgi:large subunit ribosomal protein L18
MKKLKKIVIPYRRKREGKTNYKKRLSLLKSRECRLVVRKTNKYMTVQFVDYNPDGDHVLLTLSSKSLQKDGWKFCCKNLPAAYLTGCLAGKRALAKKIKRAILDLGLHTPVKGSRIYAVLKGVIDSGVAVPAGEDVFPKPDRLSGKHLNNPELQKMFEELKTKLSKG